MILCWDVEAMTSRERELNGGCLLRILELDHREAEKHGMVGMGDFSIFSMHICHQDSFLIFFFKIEKILILKNTLQRF